MTPDPLQPLHRDPWLLAVNKPAGLLSQPGLGADQHDSLITRLRAGDGDLHLVHRLDRDTSGVLVFARNEETLKILQDQFRAHTVGKRYLALATGRPNPPSEGTAGSADPERVRAPHCDPLRQQPARAAAHPFPKRHRNRPFERDFGL